MDELFDYPDEENNDDQNDDQTQRRDSDDSFIVDDDRSVEDFEGASDNREDSNDDDYDFLFGIPQEDKAEEENKVKRRVKDLEKLLSSRAGAYDEFEGTEDEIRYTLEDLSYFYKSRQALELELLSLFSGLIKREKISQTKNHMKSSKEYQATNVENLFTDRETARKDDGNKNKFQKYNINKRKQSEKTMNKFLKNIIKQTFRNDQPEGRFGRFSKDKENASHLRSMDTGYEGDENVLVTIDSEAVANLRDINTLLHRERRGDYEEMEGVPLYKYPRCASIYIFSHNFMSSFILPLCSVLNRGSVSEAIDVDQLVNELIYFFYQITQPPSENWYNYWMTAQSIYKVINLQLLQSLGKDSQDAPNRSFKGDEEKNSNVKIELKYRTRVIDSYIKGLNTLRSAMESSEIWSIIGEFRLKLEHFKQNGYISKEDLEELNSMKELQQSLSTERDNLIKEVEQLEEEEDRSELNRLRKDRELAQEVRNAAMAKKKRIKQIRRELYDVTTNINEVNKRVDATRTKSEFHMQTVRILISQVLTIKSNMGMLYIFNELGILTLIRQELLMFFRTIRKAIVPVTYVPDQTVDPGASKTDENAVPEQQHEEKGDYEYYPSYLTQLERNMLWQYVRIVYNILSGINVTSLLGEVKGVKGEDKAHGERDSKEGGGSSSSSRDTGSSTNRVNGSGNRNGHQQQGVNNYKSRDQLLEERDRMERSYLIEMYRMNPKLYNKFNDRVFSYNVRSANYNQKNNYHYTFKYSHTTGGSNEATREEKDKESLQNELNLLIGINSSLEHISFSNNTAREGEVVAEKKEVDYELVLMLLVCCYDINREVDEEYYEPYDRLILFNIKSFVIRYYSMVYVKHSAKKAPKTMPTSLLFLAIKRYIGEDNIFTKLLLTYLNQLVKKLNYQNNQVIIQLIQNAHTELSFIQSFHTSASLSGKETSGSKDDGGVANGNVDGDGGEGSGGSDPKRDKEQAEMEEEYINNICKEFFVEYIKNNIRLMMFNLLKNFKMSYNRVLFVSSLRLVLLLEKLALKIGPIEFVPITGYSSNERLLGKDLDDEFWDEEDEDREEDTWDPKGRKKLVRVDERNIYNCKNNNFVRNDILRNGRIVHNAMLLLLSRNSRGKDVLLAYLDKVPRALLYDFKYFLLINSRLNNSMPTVNTSRGLNLGTRFGMRKEQAAGAKTENALFMEIVESFMDKWLLEDNKVMLLELFLNKNVATVSASTSRVNYNINSKFYIDPIESNDYLNCPIVQGVMDQDQEDIVDIMANLSISKEEQKVERKAKIDDQLLLQYYNRFKYMNEGVVKYLSDLLNIPVKQLQRHLDELLETNAGAGVGSGSGPGGVQDGVEAVSKHTRRGASGGAKYDKESLIRVMARFYAEHKDDALDVMREMHENLLESAEMYKLSGLEVEVIEPIQLTEELKRSGHYEKLLAHLNVEEATNVLKGVEGLEPKLEALREFVESPFLPKAEENEVEAAEADQEWEEVVDVHNVTSKDIIKLLIDLSSLYDFENDDDLFDEGEPPKVSAEVDGTLVPEVEPQQQQVPEQQQPTVPEQPVLEQPYEEQQPPVLEQQQPTLPDLQQPPVREHQTVLEQKVDKQRRYELILEEERKKINELLDVCFDIISNSDKSDYVRYYSFSNMHQDELKVSDASEGDYGMDVDVKFEKLNVSRELLMRKLLKYCNIGVKNNIIRLVDNKVNPEIVKNRLNIIKSLHKLSKLQLIDILSRQQEQTMGHDNEVVEPDFEENMAKYDNEAQEHTFDYSGMDFSKKKTPRRGVSRSIDVDKGDEYDNRDFDKDHGADKDDKGDQESLSGFRKKLDKVKKVQGKRTVKESKRKKKLKKSQLADAEELDNENVGGGDDASVDYNDSFEAKLAENDGERPTDRYGVHQTKKLVEGAKTSKQTAGKQPKQPRKQRQKRKLGEEVHPETQPTAREHEELGDGFDYRSLVGVKTRDSAVDKVEREHIRELAGFKRVPDIVIEIHNRSLALAKEQKLSNSMNYKRLMEYTSAIS